MNILNFLLLIILVLNICNKRRFKNRINTLHKSPSILKVGYWFDYYKNYKFHLRNLKDLVILELDRHSNLKKVDRDNIIKYTPYKEMIKFHLFKGSKN